MDKFKKIDNALKNCATLTGHDKYVNISDLHLGIGDNKDSSMKNALFIFEALKYYLENDYHVILAGDTFDLAENKDIEKIKMAHEDIMWVLEELYKKGHLTILHGNHDEKLSSKMLKLRKFSYTKKEIPFLENINIYNSAKVVTPKKDDFVIMHGHQVEPLYQPGINSIINFFLYTIWGPLENFFCKDVTANCDFIDTTKVDEPFNAYATVHNCTVICGHTHSVTLTYPNYFNIGGGVLPRCITCGEIIDGQYIPYKWSYVVDENGTVFIKKTPLK